MKTPLYRRIIEVARTGGLRGLTKETFSYIRWRWKQITSRDHKRLVSHAQDSLSSAAPLQTHIPNRYVLTAPHPQNALDIFGGEWACKMPAPLADLQAGTVDAFNDFRMRWLEEKLGRLDGKTVLELGPLEGGHTYMLSRLGAESVISIESNTHAYLKCLIVKELLGLPQVQFLCGDFIEYLRADGPSFDICVASGVLYHMRNPVELIALLAKRCKRHLFLWTHYYDENVVSKIGHSYRFTDSQRAEYEGFQHTLHRYEYLDALKWGGFCGGNAPYSYWMERDEILECLAHYGFGDFYVNFDDKSHPDGPCFAIIAQRG